MARVLGHWGVEWARLHGARQRVGESTVEEVCTGVRARWRQRKKRGCRCFGDMTRDQRVRCGAGGVTAARSTAAWSTAASGSVHGSVQEGACLLLLLPCLTSFSSLSLLSLSGQRLGHPKAGLERWCTGVWSGHDLLPQFTQIQPKTINPNLSRK